ncbi:MAG: hypothetical protein QMC04_06785 [Ilumatobacter sp.]
MARREGQRGFGRVRCGHNPVVARRNNALLGDAVGEAAAQGGRDNDVIAADSGDFESSECTAVLDARIDVLLLDRHRPQLSKAIATIREDVAALRRIRIQI